MPEEFQPLSKKGKKFNESTCSPHTFLNLHQEIFCKHPSFAFPPMTTTVIVSNEFPSLRNALLAHSKSMHPSMYFVFLTVILHPVDISKPA